MMQSLTYPVSNGPSSQLNTVEVHIPRGNMPAHEEKSRPWLVFIHGGAWRSPSVSATSFVPALRLLESPSELPQMSRIAGYASVNYRLSPYPSHPSAPSEPGDPARNVQHPTHVRDVLDSLAFLQETYGFGENYILAGHSAGASLAWHVIMSRWRRPSHVEDGGPSSRDKSPSLPLGILCLAGIYDLVGLHDRHTDNPVYEDILYSAFPDGPETWSSISPTTWLGGSPGILDKVWPNGRLILVGHSRDDELVEEEQALELMQALKKHDNVTDDSTDSVSGQDPGSDGPSKANKKRRISKLVWLQGYHDDIFEQGHELAKMISMATELLNEA